MSEPITAPRTITEQHIQRGIRDCLEALGYSVYSTKFSIRSDPGFPDVFAIRARDGAMVAAEIKGPHGVIRPGQLEWLALCRGVPGCVFAFVVGPTDTDRWLGYDTAIAAIQAASTPGQPGRETT